MKNLIMRDQADKSWLNDDLECFTKEETKALIDVEYGFMKNLLKISVAAIALMAVAHYFKI